jgi:hypothetical protein
MKPRFIAVAGGLLCSLLWAQQQTSPGYTYAHLTGPSYTVLKSAAGVLHTITVNNPANPNPAGQPQCSATVYDATTNSGTQIAVIDCTAKISLLYDVKFQNGLTVDMGTNTADLTVGYQ